MLEKNAHMSLTNEEEENEEASYFNGVRFR